MKKKLALYLRKSREDKTGETFEVMRSRLIRIAEEMGREYDIYEDIIGGDKDKDDLTRLLDNIKRYDSILTDAVDRIGRDDRENAEIKQTLWINDVEVITPNKVYDFDNDSDEMMFGLESLFAKWEHKQIKRRLKNGKVDRFRLGQYTTGKPPLGYIRNPDTRELEIVEDEAEIVRYLFQLSADGHGASIISQRMNERGYRTTSGRAFPISHIRTILKNKTYIGTTTLRVRNKRGEVTETIENPDSCPPIVSLELFIQANEEMERRNKNRNFTRGYVKSFLSGLIKCKFCGNGIRIQVHTRNKSLFLKACEGFRNGVRCENSGVKLEYIEEAVLHDLRQYQNVLRDVLNTMIDANTDDTKERLERDLRAFQNRLKEIDKEDDRLDDLAIDGLIKKDKLKARKQSLEKESSDLNVKIMDLKLRIADLNNNSDIDRLEQEINKIENFESLDLEEQNAFLKRVIDFIEYDRHVPNLPKNRVEKDFLERFPPRINIQYRQK